jgi:hypothetical protein
MQNRHTNAGAPGLVQGVALSIRKRTISQASGLRQRSSIWAARTVAVIATVFGLLRDKVTPAAASLVGRLRETAAPAIERAERLVAKVVDRFGMRVTVMGAATAIFVGSTGGTAMAIGNLDTEAAVQAQTGVAAAEAALSEESASAAAESIAEDQRAAAAAAAKEAAEPKPVGGLSKLQMANAVAIIEAGEDEGLDQKAWAIALATAMQESKFRNYANVNVAESYDYEHQAEGADHDSVGLFQQRPSSGWGSVKELMDPKTSASKFYDSLKNVDGWQDMPVTTAAQTVQVSAFPDAYAQWEDLAWDIIDAYNAR